MLIGAWQTTQPARTLIRARRTYYAITDRRVLILTTGKSNKVTAIAPAEFTDFERTENPNGTGSILLRKTRREEHDGVTSLSAQFIDGLWGIADVRGAAKAIEKLRQNPKN